MSWKQLLTRTPLCAIAAPTYDALVRAELSICSWGPGPAEPEATRSGTLSDVTAVIKTFERPKQLRRLVDSLRRFHPEMPLIVVDDSRAPAPILGVRTICLPFDSGVGEGRNAGISAVQTPYVLNLDDDYIFSESRGLRYCKAWMDSHPEVDLAAGRVTDLPFLRELDVQVESSGERIDDRPVVRYALNFYLGRTDAVRGVGYDPKLRRVEHRDFFSRCSELCCVHLEELRCLHARTPFDVNYRRHREDTAADAAHLRQKWG